MVGLEREHRVLLDEQQAQAVVPQPPQGLADDLDQLGRQPHRGLVEQQQHRPGHQRPADGQHLLLAAGQRAGQPAAHLREHREQLVDLGQRLPGLSVPAARVRAEQQVLLHGQPGEDMAALRHVADAEPHHVAGGHLRQVAVAEPHLARRPRHQPHQGPQGRGLAGAVGADQADRLARLDGEADRRDRRHAAVPDGEVADGQRLPLGPAASFFTVPPFAAVPASAARTCPGRPRGPRGRGTPGPGGPRRSPPAVKHDDRSHSDITRPMLCSMRTTVTPLSLMDRTMAASCDRSSPFSPAAGSSSSSSRGELAIARASSSRRWMP